MADITPMMKQYMEIKKDYQDTILMYRLGDFYEMFYDDAVVASKELELVLTGRACGQGERAPMCGVPFHSVDSYIAKLVSRGYKVAICEQTEDPATAKGIVKRDVIRIITPGTVIENTMLDESRNNYLASIVVIGDSVGMCFVDVSTGKLNLTSLEKKKHDADIINEVSRFSPSEIIINKEVTLSQKLTDFISSLSGSTCDLLPEESFDFEKCKRTAAERFSVEKLGELSLLNNTAAICALGSSLEYLREMQKTDLENINDIEYYSDDQFMRLDHWSRRNLEITETMRSREKKGSLLWVLDKTKTPMGKRLLREWLDKPLINHVRIIARQNAVGELTDRSIDCEEIRKALSGVYDLERLMTRILYKTANAKELNALRATAECLPEIKEATRNFSSTALKGIFRDLDTLEDIRELISNAIVDEAPFSVREGGMIKDGFNSELDELHDMDKNGAAYIAKMQLEEQEKTGIKKLKIGFNKVFGYFIEVPNSFKDAVPEEYIRKQTLVNCERYITQELKDFEAKILSARERMVKLEYEIFCQVRDRISEEFRRIQTTARAIAYLDVLCSLATVAVENGYCCPEITTDSVISITEGRHPVVEKMLKGTPFVPNDTLLDCSENRCAIITGPNMAGKSTYMRQVALICLMAQIGSFVPAKTARLGVVDAIFTRVGASDDLAAGASTFMVEMSEVASIMKNATSKSLIILDEIGRGTSTFDGMSIARAVVEFVSDKKKLGAKTLFATHYHELTELENVISGVKNYNISVKKRGDNITFLRRIIRGSADGSYGIEVAKLAGVPNSIVNRARVILSELESSGFAPGAKSTPIADDDQTEERDLQISMVSNVADEIYDELKNTDADTLTPIEALNILYKLINKVKNS
ncbi:MAG: DNA mismatch repair protein MutS [Acutalibacteraceae bacterium]